MTFFQRTKALIGAAIASIANSFNFAMPNLVPVKVPFVKTAKRPSENSHLNREMRAKEGIPHGVSGAKLARKAAAGQVGKAVLK